MQFRSFRIKNWTNCIFSLGQLTSRGGDQNNIDIQELIDTIVEPSIFSAFDYVPGTIIIEPSNSDFNYSKFVAFSHDGTIHDPFTGGSGKPTEATRLSQHEWIGVGVTISVTIGFVVLATVFALTWAFLSFKRQLGEPMEQYRATIEELKKGHESHVVAPVAGLHEAEGGSIVREMPNDYRYIHELHVAPTELPTSYQETIAED
ncbi:hypothetical protein F4859DRAFT_529659 [Xylaria cf. heliscus]|nr:hypothetical protein F4859DRAFT_529659 [Xylaria cf. heliscus]